MWLVREFCAVAEMVVGIRPVSDELLKTACVCVGFGWNAAQAALASRSWRKPVLPSDK